MFYINPNYYGFSSTAKLLLADYVPCNDTVECYLSTGDYALKTFNFDNVRPYMHISVSTSTTQLSFIPILDITSHDRCVYIASHI